VDIVEKYKAIDLFCGPGGFSEGFRQARFELVCGIDKDKDSCATYQLNQKSPVIEKDIYDVDLQNLPKANVIIGSPPCKGFSLEGKRDPNDERNLLYEKFVEAVGLLQPDFFVMENVTGMINVLKGRFFDRIMRDLKKTDYKCCYKVLNSADYGVPQLRKRVFIMGSKKYPLHFPHPTHHSSKHASLLGKTLQSYVTLGEAILDLPELAAGEGSAKMPYTKEPMSDYQATIREGSSAVYNHRAQKHSKRMVEKMSKIPMGGDMSHILEDYDENRTFYCGGYRRADPKSPSHTVYWTRAMTDIHPYQPRLMTARECARLQGFHDRYRFLGASISQYTQISNAVPPFLAKAIAEEIIKIINDKTSVKPIE